MVFTSNYPTFRIISNTFCKFSREVFPDEHHTSKAGARLMTTWTSSATLLKTLGTPTRKPLWLSSAEDWTAGSHQRLVQWPLVAPATQTPKGGTPWQCSLTRTEPPTKRSKLPIGLLKRRHLTAPIHVPDSSPSPESQQHCNQFGLRTPTRPLVTWSLWTSMRPAKPKLLMTTVAAAVNRVTGQGTASCGLMFAT